MGILSTGCVAVSQPAPRAPGSGMDAGPEVATTPTAFSVEEHERIASVDPWVDHAAKRHRLDPDLIRAVIWVESRYVPRAKSPAGARGLMQLMPATAAELARKLGTPRANPHDPEFNIAAGSLYLAEMVARYRGDTSLALSAYNAGPGNVDRWRAEGLPPRNREYVELVLAAKARFEAVYHMPQGRPVDTQIARAAAPDRRPAIVIPEPPPSRERASSRTEDGVEVRYDLDRVESDYHPVVEDPPMGETPAPSETPARGDAEDDEQAPAVGRGVLPSLAD